MSQPRVIMLIERFAPLVGGSERQCQLQAKALHQAGWDVRVLTRKFFPDWPIQQTIDGVTTMRLGPTGVGQRWPEFWFAWRVVAWLTWQRDSYDIVHIHSGTSILGLIVIPVLRLLEKKVIVKVATAGDISKTMIETSAGDRRPSLVHRVLNWKINWALRRSHRVICISSEIEAELQQHGFKPKQLSRIPNAIDAQNYEYPRHPSSARQQLKIPADALITLTTSRLVRRKGVDVLLDAWQTIQSEFPTAWLYIVGAGSVNLDSVETEIADRLQRPGLGQRVILVGEQSDVRPYLQAADVFVFPSRREGMPNAVLEAMAAGLPVVASAIGGTTDIIQSPEQGLLFPSGQADKLTEQLRRILSDASLRQALSIQARSRIVNHFSLDQIRTQLEQLYREVIHV